MDVYRRNYVCRNHLSGSSPASCSPPMVDRVAQHALRPSPWRTLVGAMVAIAAVLFCRVATPAALAEAPPAPQRLGMTIGIDLPITDRTVRRVEHFVDEALAKARREKKRPVLIFEFRVPKDQEKYAGQTEFSDALKLARLLSSERLASDQTVAYVPSALPGHAVLAAMACEDVFMPGEAVFGPVGAAPESIGRTERAAYTEIADRRKTVPAEVALWLLDPSREVLVVQTEAGRECLSPQQFEELKKSPRTILSQEPLREWVKGRPGQLTGDEAWRLDVVSYKPAGREDVAKLLDLPPSAIDEDPSLVQQWQGIEVGLTGRIQPGMVTQTIRMIREQVRLGEKNFVCLRIDSPGGSLTDSVRLADFLANDLDPGKVRTVAYVAGEARADAALIALACDEVVMHPDAELGGPSDAEVSDEDVENARTMIRDEQGPWKSRPWALVAAMIDPALSVFPCRRVGQVDGEVRYLTKQEADQLDGDQWTVGAELTRPGEPLSVGAPQAIEYGLANFTAESLDELRRRYDLQSLTVLEPGWADRVVDMLKRPGVDMFLLMVAFVALYFELHTPGLGIGGFAATVAFVLFFWIKFDGETATLLEVMLFLVGVACLLLEIFVLPGFGIFGLGGGCLVLISLILASQTSLLPQNIAELRHSMTPVVVALLGAVVAAVLFQRWLPRAPILRQMLLEPPAGEEAEEIRRREAMLDLDGFVGQRGVATTQLTPGGKARFSDRLLDVITDGEVVARGTPIEVVAVEGNRLIVRASSSRKST